MKFTHPRGSKVVHDVCFMEWSPSSKIISRSDMDTAVKHLKKARIPFDIHIEHDHPFMCMKIFVSRKNELKARKKLLEFI